MTREIPFALRIQLASSVIVGRRLTLDSLLAALILERTGSVEAAHRDIPLALDRDAGVWAGSAALLEGPAPIRPVQVTQALKARLEITPLHVRPGRRGYPRVEEARGDWKNRMTTYAAHDAAAVWFTGRGDPDRVLALLDGVPGIGAKRSSGHGTVARVDLVPSRYADAGMSFSDGTPARPVPAEAWERRGGSRSALRAAETCLPPYWTGARVLCAIPTHSHAPRHDARRLAGAA